MFVDCSCCQGGEARSLSAFAQAPASASRPATQLQLTVEKDVRDMGRRRSTQTNTCILKYTLTREGFLDSLDSAETVGYEALSTN